MTTMSESRLKTRVDSAIVATPDALCLREGPAWRSAAGLSWIRGRADPRPDTRSRRHGAAGNRPSRSGGTTANRPAWHHETETTQVLRRRPEGDRAMRRRHRLVVRIRNPCLGCRTGPGPAPVRSITATRAAARRAGNTVHRFVN